MTAETTNVWSDRSVMEAIGLADKTVSDLCAGRLRWEMVGLHFFAERNHRVFGHDWPIGQCGPCLDFGDRLVRTLAADPEFRAALAVLLAEPAPTGTCCQFGRFGEPHDCAKSSEATP